MESIGHPSMFDLVARTMVGGAEVVSKASPAGRARRGSVSVRRVNTRQRSSTPSLEVG